MHETGGPIVEAKETLRSENIRVRAVLLEPGFESTLWDRKTKDWRTRECEKKSKKKVGKEGKREREESKKRGEMKEKMRMIKRGE